ncbi:MAG: bifunctional UDP-N-acetylglucosamine diphosphorylase/glucosamine-1-phosphate N-acetyltransferase GlmU [Candidatus Aminicenantes bacterium]|nr:bifunctional UDP-N-acetylglucosamine diphosphorylase/glucosamine-1-phosphate N-acetyltransferase GlmU [Candidatus Aminicenantes bacterium]
MKRSLHALILAAGKGTRFKSEKIKVLHNLMGKSMIRIVLDSVSRLKPEKIHIVIGYQLDAVKAETAGDHINCIVQKEQKGTGHAVLSAKSVLREEGDKDLLVMNGDLPLIRTETLRPFLTFHQKMNNSLTFMTAEPENPFGFGRVFKTEKGGFFVIEEKDATSAQKKIKEVNVGIYLFNIKDLFRALPKISNRNKKGEYYLTDIVEIMSLEGMKVGKFKTDYREEVVGVNDRFELALAADVLRNRKIESLTASGVTVYDPKTTWIDFDVKVGRDTILYPSVILEGKTVIGSGCKIYPFSHIIDSKIGDRTKVLTSSVVEKSTLEKDVQIGPFTRLRPNSILKQGSKVGNFVEMKNTVFGEGSKAGHLSYLGDSEIAKDVNIGAGTICCNYDGEKKNKTIIEEGAFIGSGVELVAPVKVGKNAYVGAGSTITKNVSPGSLAVERGKQIEKRDWPRKGKK